MIPLRLAELARATGGELAGGAAGDTVVSGPVVLDSRAAAPGALFVCVAGEHADGHDFAAAAVENGAVVALATRPLPVPCLVVPDAALGLGAVATAVLRRLTDVRVIGVTGSAGKTSTKDLLGAVFGTAGPTIAPAGNLNNELGLPLTVCRADADTRALVLEYGARGVGHIRYLTTVARPAIGVVLNVGAAHLGEFGSREAVAQAKGELVEALPASGTAVLNADDPLVSAMAERTPATVLTFGTAARADVRIDGLVVDDAARPTFGLQTPAGSARVRLALHGAHHAHNAAAAVAAGLAGGVPLADAVGALESATARSPHRMAVHAAPGGVVVIDDAYNASPDSTVAALRALASMSASGRRWAVLGAMRELGDETASEHARVGREAATLGVDVVLAVGPDATGIAAGASAVSGWSGATHEVPDVSAAATMVRTHTRAGDVVLVKASNSERLWRVAEELLDESGARHEEARA